MLLWGIKGVHRRKSLIQDIDNADHFEFTHLASGTGFSKLNQPRIDATLKQKLLVLLNAVLVHAATRMAAVLIAQIQVVMLIFKTQSRHARHQILMFSQCTLLTFVGLEFIAQHAHGHTCLAAIAVGPVGKEAASAKAALDQVRIHIGLNQMAGCRHLRACFTAI